MSVRTKLNHGHAVPRVGCRPAVTRGHCLTWERKTNNTFTSLCPGVHGVQGDGSSSGGAIWRLLAHGQHRERGARDHCSLCGDSGHPGAQDSCQCPLDVGPEPSWLVTGRIFPAWFPSLSWDGVGQAVQGKRAPDTGTSSPGNSLKDPISQEVLEQHAHQIGRHESEIDTHQCCQRYRTVRTHTCCWWKPTLGGSFGEQSGSAQ